MYKQSNEELYQLSLAMIQKSHYLEGLEKIKLLLSRTNAYYFDLLKNIYLMIKEPLQSHMLLIIIVELYIYRNRYDEAVFTLEILFEESPNQPNIYFYLSRIYHKSNEKKRIIDIFEKAINQNILDSSIIDILPTIYIENHEINKSITLYQKLIDHNPSNQFYLRTIADLYQKNNEFLESIKILKSLIEITPDAKESILKECEVIAKINKKDHETLLILIDLYIQYHKPQKTLPIINQMHDITLDNREKLIRLLKNAIKTYPSCNEIKISLSYLLVQKKQFSEASYYLEMCIQQNYPSNKTSIHNLLGTIIQSQPDHVFSTELLIEIYYLDRKIKDCLTIIHHYGSITTHSKPRIYQLLAEIEKDSSHKWAAKELKIMLLYKESNESLCLEECERYLEQRKEPKIFEYKANIFLNQNKLKDIHQLTKSELMNLPFNSIYHTILKLIHERSIEKKLTLSPGDETSHKKQLEVGLLYLRKGDIQVAIDYFQKIDSSKKILHQSILLTSHAFIEIGRYDKAIKVVRRLLKRQPTKETIKYCHFILGISLFLFGQPLEALQELETLSEYDINFPNLKQSIAYIKHYTTKNLVPMVIGCHHNGILIPLCTYQKTHIPGSSLAIHQNKKGIAAIFLDQIDNAKNELITATKIDSSFVPAYLQLSFLALKENNPIDASKWLQKARDHEVNAIIYYQSALINIHQNQMKQAEYDLNMSLNIDSTFSPALVALGDIHIQKQEIESGLSYWQSASMNPPFSFLIKRRSNYLSLQSLSPLKWINESNEKLTKRLLMQNKIIKDESEPIIEASDTINPVLVSQPSLFNFTNETH